MQNYYFAGAVMLVAFLLSIGFALLGAATFIYQAWQFLKTGIWEPIPFIDLLSWLHVGGQWISHPESWFGLHLIFSSLNIASGLLSISGTLLFIGITLYLAIRLYLTIDEQDCKRIENERKRLRQSMGEEEWARREKEKVELFLQDKFSRKVSDNVW
ncbi:MAG: hypothetical protein NWS22_02505 [Porticoccaceae bacterium]|jgi:hypothetical protein|nr:hypothetical protein [Porticoccaceae bacterium]